MKKVLVLGAGLVAKPHVDYLLKQPDFHVTVASRTVSKAEKLIANHPRGVALALNVKDEHTLEKLVSEHDLSVSLLPYVFHPLVAKLCIKHKKHMVTASYVSEKMKSLDMPARAAGVTILNEIGVDPGMDHMSAMRVINHVKKQGGRVTSFMSYCGGVPAPEANTNPWGYKFSWSPRGVIMAGKNSAKFKKDNAIIDIPGPDLFAHHWPLEVPGFGTVEAYPNRNSLPYLSVYNIEEAHTIFRGTLRYPGWCRTMKHLVDMGMVDDEKQYNLEEKTYGEFLAELMGEGSVDKLSKKLALLWKEPIGSDPIQRMDWLGMLGPEKIGLKNGTAMDVFCKLLLEKLQFEPGEQDLLLMHHEFIAEFPDKKQKITSTFIDYGIKNGDSSMSRTVGIPPAIAVKMILNGEITDTGVLIPVNPTIYEPILNELERENMIFVERFSEIH